MNYETYLQIKEIETQFAEKLQEEFGVAVEVIHTGKDKWVVRGKQADTNVATDFLQSHNLMAIDNTYYDDILDVQVVYMTQQVER